jgi:ATP-dependent Clp protease, protease subunit
MRKNWMTRRNNEDHSPDIEEAPRRILTLEKISDQSPQCNKIYFYDDVTKESVLNLHRQIDDLNKQMKMIQFGFGLKQPPRIEIHICSDGGDIHAAMSAVDKIADNPVPIDTYCEGIVASAATLLSAVGHKRYITKSSTMLIHQLSSGLWGNYKQFQDEIKNLDLYMDIIKGVYFNKTKFAEKELNELLSHDLCLNSEKCLEIGLVDEIL